MSVGNAENFQHALQRAVLARPAMQHIERDIRIGRGQGGSDVTACVDCGNAIAEAIKRIGTRLPGAQRDFALRRPTSHQNGDVLGHAQPNAFSGRFH
jgi:hypothetical protein